MRQGIGTACRSFYRSPGSKKGRCANDDDDDDAGCQAALESTCQEKTRRAWPKIQENILAYEKQIGPVDKQ